MVRLDRKLGRYLRMPRTDRLFLLEAALLLALARLIVLAVPFRRIAPWLERAPESSQSDGATIDAAMIDAVRRAVVVAARNVPWNAACLPQAIAAKAMLARRGQGSALHLGAGMADGGGLMAHAWLIAGGEIVVGEEGVPDVTPLVRFG